MSPTLRRRLLLGCLIGFGLWTAAVLAWPDLTAWDRAWSGPRLDPDSAWGQILSALALVSSPVVVGVVIAVMSVWAWNRGLRRLAWSMAATIVVGPLAYLALKRLCHRVRPDSPFADNIAQGGWAYPSGHVAMVTTLAILAVLLRRQQRGAIASLWLARLNGLIGVAVVAADRWAMRAHWPSDLVGGVLIGASVALAVWLVSERADPRPAETGAVSSRQAAVIYNPTKLTDLGLFHRRLDYEFHQRGWKPAFWLATTPDDPGGSMAQAVRQRGVDLVLAVGGDGTVRAVAAELIGSGLPVAIIPSGTGNILAHNLSIPLDQDGAFRVAFEGVPKLIDSVKVTGPGFSAHSTVISGLGADAAAMEATSSELKQTVGNMAYALSILQNLSNDGIEVTVRVDDRPPVVRRALSVLVSNVGGVQIPIQLFPAASLDDGLLDLLVVAPTKVVDWAKIVSGLIAGSVAKPELPEGLSGRLGQSGQPLEYDQGRRVRIEASPATMCQVDGDVVGPTSWLEAESVPQAFLVMTPPD
ncbi:MAG: phosphatase PAP2 family protein [Propionibacteriaceae bacterium]|jgi:diacylglycerol kinase family enzyme/membrane-associated phospholipid phosphatase|nr:phosphatase PAP2 family protein [Propionibacteriaceae bacterium]